MIIKKHEFPLYLKKLQALERRTPPDHPKLPHIKEEIARHLAGYKGEQSVSYPLSFLSDQNYHILHDVRLEGNIHFFQMDILLLTKSFITILEVKNMTGTLIFDQDFDQLIQVKDEKDIVYSNPITQVERHERQLKSWLLKNDQPNLPILSLVVFTNSSCYLKTTSSKRDIFRKIVRIENLPNRIHEFEQKFQNEIVDDKEIKRIGRFISKKHSPNNSTILSKFQMTQDELQKGVHCPKCNYLPLNRAYGTWYCTNCSSTQKDAHINTLHDFYLLIGNSISIREVRDFCLIDCPFLTARLLAKMNLQITGKTKNRKYLLSSL